VLTISVLVIQDTIYTGDRCKVPTINVNSPDFDADDAEEASITDSFVRKKISQKIFKNVVI